MSKSPSHEQTSQLLTDTANLLDGVHPSTVLTLARFVAIGALKCWDEPERSRVLSDFIDQLVQRVYQLDNPPESTP